MSKSSTKLTALDIFCGAGGFSEGFRQQGFNIVMGIDNWRPAVDTFNHNFNLDCPPKNVLEFKKSTQAIEDLLDTDIIIGSPPCVNFSNSNKSGNADKSEGVELIEIFLRIIAVKRYKPDSKLKAWFMENVKNSTKYLRDDYTFKELNLDQWAKKNGFDPQEIVIDLKKNQCLINSADYGTPQLRHRAIYGEVVKKSKLIIPPKTHQPIEASGKLQKYLTVNHIKKNLPCPSSLNKKSIITDPMYSNIKINLSSLSNHFYDTGLYKCEWESSKFFKVNHPYMGKMHFPENGENPSRTIMATLFRTSREALIYKSERRRKGNGEYRLPTIREMACLMGFPITYQFKGSESTKCKLIGNAVCPPISNALAKQLRKDLHLSKIDYNIVKLKPKLDVINNLNSFTSKSFDTPPRRGKKSKFRRHPFKDGNITVTLSNYDIIENGKPIGKWRTSVQYGNGKGFPNFNYSDGFHKKIRPLINGSFSKRGKILKKLDADFFNRVGSKTDLQEMYEAQRSKNGFWEPTKLIEEAAKLIESYYSEEKFVQNGQIIFKHKEIVPTKQLVALYVINKISTKANRKTNGNRKKNKAS